MPSLAEIVFVALIFLSFFIGWWLSSRQCRMVEQINHDLFERLADVRQRYDKILLENNELRAEVTKLRYELETALTEIAKLSADLAALRNGH